MMASGLGHWVLIMEVNIAMRYEIELEFDFYFGVE